MLQDNIKINDLIIKQDNAFTLAEVLVTLTIIGVVASLTVPSLVVKTKQEQYKTSAKKAYANFMQALTLAEIQTRTSYQKIMRDDDNEEIVNFVTRLVGNFNATKIVTVNDSHRILYTPDGMSWHYNPNRMDIFFVDVNGDKGPNREDGNLTPVSFDGDIDDFADPNWPNIQLNDMFVIEYGGTFQIHPSIYNYYPFQ